MRLWKEALRGGEPLDLISGDVLTLKPATDDTGYLAIGDGTNDMDVKWFGGTSAKYVLFDVGNVRVTFDDVDLMLGDNDILQLGDAADVAIKWNATNLQILPVADDTGAIHIGDGTTDMDLKWFGSTTAKYVEFNVGDVVVNFEDVDLRFGDNDELRFGDGTGGDVVVKWNATYLEATSLTNPMWAACPSRLDPNFASVAHELFDDFTEYDNTATVGNWTPYEVGTCTDALSDADPGGVVLLTCQATTDDACQQINHTGAPFKLAAGKTLWYEARVRFTGDVTQSEFSIGLCNSGEDLKAVADVLPQDGISFSKQDAVAGTVNCTASKDGTDTGAVAAVHTLVSGAWVVFGFLINGVTSITPYVNGVAKTALTATICDDEQLTPYFLVRNGDATTTEILAIDYVRVVQLR